MTLLPTSEQISRESVSDGQRWYFLASEISHWRGMLRDLIGPFEELARAMAQRGFVNYIDVIDDITDNIQRQEVVLEGLGRLYRELGDLYAGAQLVGKCPCCGRPMRGERQWSKSLPCQ